MTITKSQNLDNLNMLIFTLRLDMLSEGYQEISTWLKLKEMIRKLKKLVYLWSPLQSNKSLRPAHFPP